SKAIQAVFEEYGYSKSLAEQECVDFHGNPLPWYTYPAIEYLSQLDFSQKRVFEFGCGNSSIWWARRAKKVVSVEHDKNWYESRLDFKEPNLELYLKEDEISYAGCIEQQEGFFDVIIIDGVYREQCVEKALKKLSSDGMIIFDNSDRVAEFEDYERAIKNLATANLIEVDFKGFLPLCSWTIVTSIFLTRNFKPKYLCDKFPAKSIGCIYEKNDATN
ncbi:MAG: class I SAM-dependent methyltransferase, partial [Syntrophorhabdaceae bacterium]|nr:class I SAM-dependent methyltransferase [Syntrophorhabdaceae bacterium]